METVGWSSFYGILKIVGMFITVGGAILLSFYWGPPLKIPHAPCPGGSSTETSHVGGHKNLIVGPVLMFLCSVAWSLWLIMQPKLLTQYPAKLKLSALQCLLSSVQSTVIAAALQGNFNSWKIGWDIQLASLAYCVCLGSLLRYIFLLCQIIFFLIIFFMVVGLMHVLLVIHEGYSSYWIHIRVASLVYREERAILCGHIFSTFIAYNNYLLCSSMV